MEFATPKDFLEIINKWFNGLIALPLLAVSYGYLEIHNGQIEPMIASGFYLNISIIVLIIIGVVVFSLKHKQNIRKISSENALRVRLFDFFMISKNYYIIILIFSLVTTILLYATANSSFAGLYAFQLFALSIHKPSMLSVANKLNLKGDERTNFLIKDLLN